MEQSDHDQLIRIEGKIETIQAMLEETKFAAESASSDAKQAAILARESADLVAVAIDKRLDEQSSRITTLENWRTGLIGGWVALSAAFAAFFTWKRK